MEQIVQIVTNIRKKFMKAIVNNTDPGYYILKQKITPLSQQQAEFVEIYENTLCLHLLSIVSTVPGTLYYIRYFKAMKKSQSDTKLIAWYRRRVLFFIPFSLATVFTAYTYQRTHDFQGRMKEIEQFYLDRKDQDINTVSFRPATLQSL